MFVKPIDVANFSRRTSEEPMDWIYCQQPSEDVVARRYRCVMRGSCEESTARLEEQLDRISRTLASMGDLDARQAERVAARVDRVAPQLSELRPPPAMDGAYQRLGVAPATDEEFASLVDAMGSPDGEG